MPAGSTTTMLLPGKERRRQGDSPKPSNDRGSNAVDKTKTLVVDAVSRKGSLSSVDEGDEGQTVAVGTAAKGRIANGQKAGKRQEKEQAQPNAKGSGTSNFNENGLVLKQD